MEDPRTDVNAKHRLVRVIVIAVMAVLAGAGGPTVIAKCAVFKDEFLLKVLDLPNGIPRKDVFLRVLTTLQPGAFEACFVDWLTSLRVAAAAATGVEQPTFAVDGKTARRSRDLKNGLGALHSVSVWASVFGLSLGQVACNEKSNEIRAIPALMPSPKSLPGFELRKGLQTTGMVMPCSIREGKETIEVRYYISSLAMGVDQFARAVRSRSGVENGCHWVLDTTYHEEESRMREKALRENFAWLNRFTLSLLKQHSGRDSLAMKRRGSGWIETYLLEVPTGAKL